MRLFREPIEDWKDSNEPMHLVKSVFGKDTKTEKAVDMEGLPKMFWGEMSPTPGATY